jgi:hypothetical protein
MVHRTEAGGWIVVTLVLVSGCTALSKREVRPPSEPSPVATPPAKLAADVQPVSHTESNPPGVPTTTEPDPLARLLRDAEQACSQYSCYICRLRRREQIAGKQKPEEVILFKCRAHPFSVHFKWLGDEGKGREVAFVGGQGDDKLHILTAAGDIPFTPAGRRLDMPINSLLVKSASKYPITEAGVCRIVARFHRLSDDERRGLPGLTIKYLGMMQRPEFPTPVEMVELTLPPNREPEAPQGGRRLLGFDPTMKWPVYSTTFDPNGREIDYYCFDRFQLNVRLDDDDFDPEKLWPIKKNIP